MRSLRVSSVHLFFALGLAAVAAASSACSSSKHGKSEPPDELGDIMGETGSLGLALTARGSSGTLYRLRQATFDVFRLGGVAVPPLTPVPDLPPSAVDAGPIFGIGGSAGTAGSASTGGGAGTGGFGGFGGSVAVGGAGGGVVVPPSPGDFFDTTLSSENDPLSSTLEATIPTGAYQITLFDGWFLEKVVDGEAQRVNARLSGSSFQNFTINTNEQTFVSYRFETNGEVVEFGQGRLIVQIEVEEKESLGPNARRGVIETNLDALQGVSLRGALDAALQNSGASASGVTATDAYHAIIDSYSSAATGRDPAAAHCDDQTTGGVASLNGFPLMCPRLEGAQFDNLDAWFPLAFVNRLDLAPADGANCGQQRIIFANGTPNGNSRMFMILEAQVPNPNPGCGVDACRPIAEFWSALTNVDDPILRGQMLQDAFLRSGVGPFGPFMNSAQLGPEGGQVRTNNFNDFVWTLREFHFQSAPAVVPLPAPVAEAPNGELWNDLSPLPQGEACRQSFLAALPGLLGDNLSAMSFPIPEQCKDAESPNDFFRQDYQTHLASGSGAFIDQLQQAVAGTGLDAFDIANRARFAGSCMGCHQEASGSSLGGGLSAPFQGDFVHVSEFSTENCGDGTACRALSSALRDEFLPHRLEVQSRLLASPSSCGGGGGGTGGGTGTGGSTGTAGTGTGTGTGGGAAGGPILLPPIPDRPIARELDGLRLTIGGQAVTEHGH
ncbi:MAG TPA: hypothetical protein VFS67_01700 [Polyangiaceae bacterium]|nr:hypothetical protein [Polyangiaceae bacterium]